MPKRVYKRKFKKRFKKKFPISKSLFPLSRIQYCRHRYADYLSLDAAIADAADNYYRCNSAFDPDYTNGGSNHQPMLFDEMSSLYNKYQVISSKITVKAYNTNAATLFPVLVLRKDNDVVAAVDPKTLIEQRRAGCRYVNLPNDGTGRTLSLTWSLRRDEGVKDFSSALHSWGAEYNANPVSDRYFCVSLGSLNGLDLAAVPCAVSIEYNVLWYSPKDVNPS